ncbi:MAG: hypothetical protein IT232_08990 [Flavobacteriales bacterium]|nr:hypothetical protein [Flavobacteriales bacterium]
MTVNALWIFDKDLPNLSNFNIIASRFSLAPPIHTYSGTIEIEKDRIRFSGIYINNSAPFDFSIYQRDIIEIYHGFDELYSVYLVRGLGLWKPLKIRFQNGNHVSSIYIISNYKMGFSGNSQLFNVLKDWLGNE